MKLPQCASVFVCITSRNMELWRTFWVDLKSFEQYGVLEGFLGLPSS